MKRTIYKMVAWVLTLGMILSISLVQTTGFAESAEDLDLSILSEKTETVTETTENYSYIWTVEDSVKKLELTLDGANIQTLTLPCQDFGSGTLHIVIDTQSDSYIGDICESHVFSYSYQWSGITFKGEGVLNIEYMNIQGGANNHIINVSEGANVNVGGEYAGVSFGASGNSNSTLNVDGSLSVNGNVYCGNVKIGATGQLHCNRITLSGSGANDTDEYENTFVIEDGGFFEAVGSVEEYDDETGEQYGAFVIATADSDTDAEKIFVVPEGYLPVGYNTAKTDGYFTIDDGDDKIPQSTNFDYGVIYAAKSLVLQKETILTYTVTWENYDGTILETDENVAYGEIPSYDGEIPQKEPTDQYTYSFIGWDNIIDVVTEDVTYTAVFESIEIPPSDEAFTVKFETNGGKEIADLEVSAGSTFEKPQNPTKSGYTFKGWYADEELEYKYDFESAVTSDLTLYAKWQKRQSSGGGGTLRYSIKFNTAEGSQVKDVAVERNSKLTKPEDPTKEGYVFDGWYTEETYENPYDFENKVTSSFTLYAKWRKKNVSDILNVSEHFAYVKGYSDNTVRPENNITRAETAEIFFRLLSDEVRNENIMHENAFDDAQNDAWYNTSLSTLTMLGIVKGKSDNLFMPDDFITRAEFAAICARFDDSEFEVSEEFEDLSGHWAESEIYEASAHGWIKGYEDKTFRPDEFITRAEAVTMINRMLGRTPETKDDLSEDMVRWSDNADESKWYYIAIQEATNDHSYTYNGSNEKWIDK